MKILLLQDAEWRKKGPHQQHHLMELMSLRGHEIRVICFDQLWKEDKSSLYSKRLCMPEVCRFYEGAKVSYIRPAFIRFQLLDYISLLFSSKKEISKQVHEFNPDIIIGFSSILTNYWGIKIAKKLKIPYLYYCYDNPSMLNVPKPFISLAESIVVHIMEESDKVLTINKALNDYVIDLGANPLTTNVLPQGVDLERFKTSEIKRRTVRDKYNVSDDDILLFFMGWLYTFSGLKEVILDIHKYRDIYPQIKLMIVGYGDDYENLKNLIQSLKLEHRVMMTGQKPYSEIPELIAAADICLLPAHNDDIIRDIVPIKIYEYLAMHKPIISTKLPGMIREIGQNNGVIFVDSPENVINTIVHLSKEDIISIQTDAMKFIDDYDWGRIITQFERVLSGMIT